MSAGLAAIRRAEDLQPDAEALADRAKRQQRAEQNERLAAWLVARHGVAEIVGLVAMCRCGWPAEACEVAQAIARILGYPFPWDARPRPGGA